MSNESQPNQNDRILDNAHAFDNARLCDDARMCHNAAMHDNAVMMNRADLYHNASMRDNALMCGDSNMCENSCMSGHAVLAESAALRDRAHLSGRAVMRGRARMLGDGVATAPGHVLYVDMLGPAGLTSLTVHPDTVIGIRVNFGIFTGSVAEFVEANKYSTDGYARRYARIIGALVEAVIDALAETPIPKVPMDKVRQARDYAFYWACEVVTGT